MKNKLILLVFFVVCTIQVSFAQSCQWDRFAEELHQGVGDRSSSVATDAYGNVYTTGYFGSPTITFFATTTSASLSTVGSADVFLTKYDALGNVKWAQRAGGSMADEATSVASDAAGNIYITGYFYSPTITFGSTTLAKSGIYSNIFLVKYDSLGNVIWTKSAVGFGMTSSVTTDAFGNIYITGDFSSETITFDTIMLSIAGGGNAFLVKYNALGNVIWAKNTTSGAISVNTDAFGNVYITGNYSDATLTFGSTTLTNAGSRDAFLTKYDSLGNVIWARDIGGSGYDEVNSVTTDATGDVFITGYFDSPTITFDTTLLTIIGYNSLFLAKYDALGNVIWARTTGGEGDDMATSVATDASGNVYIAGNFKSLGVGFGGNMIENEDMGAYSNDIFIAKYDTHGNALWASRYGGYIERDDYAYSIATDTHGAVYITGYYCGVGIFLAKFNDNTTNITSIRQESPNLTLYPNPTNNGNLLTLSCNSYPHIATIAIVDVLGRQVYMQTNVLGNTTTNATTYNIALPSLPGGMYYLHATGDNINESLPFVVSGKK